MKKKNIIIILLLVVSLFGTGFKSSEPHKVYRVYLEGKSLGIIKSEKELENYIDKQQEHLKEKFDVDKVYAPDTLDIKKEITYNEDLSTVKEIYKKLENKSPFTIDGYAIKINSLLRNIILQE